jgi:hypothetical protein
MPQLPEPVGERAIDQDVQAHSDQEALDPIEQAGARRLELDQFAMELAASATYGICAIDAGANRRY